MGQELDGTSSDCHLAYFYQSSHRLWYHKKLVGGPFVSSDMLAASGQACDLQRDKEEQEGLKSREEVEEVRLIAEVKTSDERRQTQQKECQEDKQRERRVLMKARGEGSNRRLRDTDCKYPIRPVNRSHATSETAEVILGVHPRHPCIMQEEIESLLAKDLHLWPG